MPISQNTRLQRISDKEEWRIIEGTDNRYCVSSRGAVRDNLAGIVLKVTRRKDYSYVKMNNRTFSVHRLVGAAFLHKPEGADQINHMNGVKSDNRADNLEWCTAAHNMQHAVRTGLLNSHETLRTIPSGFNANRKITPELADKIKAGHRAGFNLEEMHRALFLPTPKIKRVISEMAESGRRSKEKGP